MVLPGARDRRLGRCRVVVFLLPGVGARALRWPPSRRQCHSREAFRLAALSPEHGSAVPGPKPLAVMPRMAVPVWIVRLLGPNTWRELLAEIDALFHAGRWTDAARTGFGPEHRRLGPGAARRTDSGAGADADTPMPV